jgi:hypothetical protein
MKTSGIDGMATIEIINLQKYLENKPVVVEELVTFSVAT